MRRRKLSAAPAASVSSSPRSLVARKVVQGRDVAGGPFGGQFAREIGLEGVAVDGPADHEGCDHATAGQADDESGRRPMAVRNAHAQALVAPAAAVGAGHVRLRPSLVDEYTIPLRLAHRNYVSDLARNASRTSGSRALATGIFASALTLSRFGRPPPRSADVTRSRFTICER